MENYCQWCGKLITEQQTEDHDNCCNNEHRESRDWCKKIIELQ